VRILHVVPTYLPAVRYGGPIVAVHGLCRALAARGHDVTVFTTNVDGGGVSDVPVATPVDIDGVRVTYFASELPRLYRSRGMARALAHDARSFDVIHAHSIYLWPTWIASRAAARAGVPSIISPRGMLVRDLIARKSRIVKTAWLRLIERRNFARAAAIHFTAQREWDDAKALAIPLPHPFVVPNGIDLLPRPNLPRDAHTLAYLGRINWKKRLDVIIDALPALPGVVFRIAGNDEEGLTPVLRALAERRGVADRVEFTGPLYGDAKFAFLARATLFVLPSLSENFGNVVVEAMMMETPVVVSPAVGLAEQLAFRGAGIVADDFSSAIDTALRDDALRAELGASGRAYVEEELTWPRVAAQMEEAYQRCCAR
jgi:glycosyltransferase involved in cell wall biosynthesis